MGTNFYTLKGEHIGKRSAAGYYCWNCGVTLCEQGNEGIHYSASRWLNKCPKCGAKPRKESFDDSSAGKELGFNKINGKRSGVSSCCSFTWAIDPSRLKFTRFVKDEYGTRYTKAEFDKELEFCPIQYTDMIGREFS